MERETDRWVGAAKQTLGPRGRNGFPPQGDRVRSWRLRSLEGARSGATAPLGESAGCLLWMPSVLEASLRRWSTHAQLG